MWDDCFMVRVCRKNLKKIFIICFIIVNMYVTSTGENPEERGRMGGRLD